MENKYRQRAMQERMIATSTMLAEITRMGEAFMVGMGEAFISGGTHKSPLTEKQRKARKKNKASRKARKRSKK